MALLNPFRYGTNRITNHLQAILIALFVLTTSARAQNVNVTATAGTPAASYLTLNAAFSAINLGTHQGAIVCTVVANTTEPAPPVPLLPSGGTSSYTSILINCTGNVTINSAAIATASRGVIEIQGDNVTIDGDDAGTGGTRNLTFQAVAQATTGVAVVRFASPSAADGATNNTIRNCIVIGPRNSTISAVVNFGIYAGVNGTGATSATGTGDNLDNLTIQNNEVRRTWWGIYVSGTTGNKADNLVIRNNIVGSATAADAVVNRGIYIQNTQTAASTASAIVEGNDITIRADAGGTANDIANIEVANGNGGAFIRKNKIHDGLQANTGGQGCYGIFVTGATDNAGVEISNNFIWDLNNDNWSTAISATSADIPIGIKVSVAATGLKIYHNTISLNKANNDPATAGYSACLQLHVVGAAGSDIRNNIFSNTQVAQAASVHVCVLVPAGFPFGTINNNDYYDSQTYTHVGWNGAVRSTLADWQGQTLQDGASTNAAPTFVSTTDLHITGTPAALNNTGANAGFTTDIDDQYRSNPPDIGADEFTTQPCAGATATVNYVQDCANSQFFLDVTVTALNGSASVDVGSDYSGNPGADLGVGLGTFQIGPFPSNTNVQVILSSTTSPLCNATIGTYNFDCATNGQNALSFDGVNDRVDIPASASLSVTGTAFTVEAWVYPTSFSTAGEHGNSIVNKEGPAGAGYILRCGNNGQIGFSVGVGTFPVTTAPVGTLVLNQWQHVAGVYNGVDMRIYKNGVLVNTPLAQTGSMIASAGVNVAIGNWINGNDRPFAGKIDEVRIWSAARTVPQLTANMNNVLCGTETGLRAYYQLNQGTAGGNNAGITSAPDFTVNANNGNAVNMALTGPTSNWVLGKTGLGACLGCSPANATATVQQDCANNNFYVSVVVSDLGGNPSVDVLSNFAGNPGGQTAVGTGTYLLGPFTSNANVQVNVNPTGFPACNLVVGTYTYDCSTFGQNALSFDGTNDRVECGTAPSISITGTAITLEAWIYPTSWRTSSFEGSIINKEGPNLGYMLRCGATGTLSFALGNGLVTPVQVLSATNALTLNTWQHVAGTYDGTTMRIYRDGVQVGTIANTQSLANTPNQLMIGDYSAGVGTRNFPGKIDEVRIWNVTRSQAEIAVAMNQLSCAGTTGLQAYYQFNEGVESANNAGVTALPDVTGNSNNGTLVNFALNGATSNWVIGKTGLTPCPACNGVPTPGTITGTSPVCSGANTTLTLTGTTYASGLTYQWSYGPPGNPTANALGTLASQSTASIPVGTWEVIVSVDCPTFGSASSLVFPFVKNQTPTATPSSNSPVCVGQPLNLTGGTDIGTTFAWTGPLTYTSNAQSPTVSATATLTMAGTYNFTATANGCSSAPVPTVVVINSSPVISSITATPNPICTGGNSQLNASVALGNAANYSLTPISGSFTALVGGTPASVTATADGELSTAFPIGFTFPYAGTNYTQVQASSDGFVRFGTGGATTLTNNLASATNVRPGVAALWDDLQCTQGITYQTSGAPGSQVLTIEYRNMEWNWLSTTAVISFQVKLFETTGVIQIVYQQEATAVNTGSASVGIMGNTAADFISLQDLGAAPVISTSTSMNTLATKPATGQIYQFTPPSATYSWTDPGGDLSSTTIANPLATTVASTTAYAVTVTGGNGCSAQGNVTLTVDPPPAAIVNVVQDCPNSQFSIALDVTSTGTGANVTFTYRVNGGAPVNVGPYTDLSVIPNIGPFAANDVVNVTLNHQSVAACAVPFGNYYSGCPQLIDCPTILPVTHCYTNNDPRRFWFRTNTPTETVTVSFISGTMDPNDVIRGYSGTDNSGTPIPSLTGSFANLAGVTGTALGQDLFIEIDSDGSNSCGTGQTTWSFQAQCTPGCTPPDAAISTTNDCPNQQFSIGVEVLFNGDGATSTLAYTVNGGSPILMPGLLEFDIVNIGPFALGDNIGVVLQHEYDGACDHNYGDFTVSPLACPNDEPCDARPVTVNPDYTCTVTSPGDMTGSTLTAGLSGACGTAVQDEWFTFVATAITQRVQIGGSTSGLSYSLWSAATCAGPFTVQPGFGCIAATTITDFNGLTIGQTYYLRVSRTTTGTNAYTVCVSAPPASFIGENALYFGDGTLTTNDRVDCGTASSIDITGNAITLEAWIYPTAWRTSSFEGNIINRELPGFGGYMLRCGATGSLSFNLGNGGNWMEVVSATNALTLNTWQHVAGTFDGTTLRIYRDGVLLTPATSAGTIAPIISATAAQPLTIGNWSQSNTRGFVGKIDETRIWNTTLSQATLAANMNQEMCGGEAGLRAYYQFNEGVDGGNNVGVTTLPDVSGNGNNGTLVNFALTGPTSNWVQGQTGLIPCPPCASAPTAGSINGTSPVCAGVAHTLSLVGPSTGTGISYQWYYGPIGTPTANLLGTSLTQSTASIPAGTWEVVVDVTCSGFGTSTTSAFSFVKNPTPTATAGANITLACVGNAISLTGGTDIGDTFGWTGPNAFTSALQNPSVTASATTAMAGNYIFTTSLNGCSNTSTVGIAVNTNPVITSVTATPPTVCETTGTSQLSAIAPAAGYTSAPATFAPEACQANTVPVGDDVVTLEPIGFSFTYFGVTYTQVGISTNGNLQMGNGSGTAGNPAYSTAWTEAAIPNAAVPNNIIALAWDDWFPTAGQITYGTIGIAPNRKLVVCYSNITGRGDGGAGTLNGQVVLEEGTNRILMHQTTMNVTTNTTGFTVQGLEDATGSAASTVVAGRNNAAQWSATNETVVFTPNSYDMSWSPATLLSATNIPNPVFGPGATAGSYPYVVTATNPVTTCFSTANISVTVNPALTAGQSNITPASPFFCGAGTVALTANPTGGGGPYTYAWTDPNSNPAGTNQTVAAGIAGTWSVLITDNCGGTATASTSVAQNPIPTAVASSNPACLGTTLNLTGTTDIGTGFTWTGPNSFSSALQNPSIPGLTAAGSGAYIFTASLNGCSSSSTLNLVATPTPTLTGPTATPTAVCTGSNSQLNALSVITGYSMGAGGATFIDISGSGTPVPSVPNTLADDSEHAITLPAFTYNGVSYTSALVGNNGAMVFGVSTGTIGFGNAALTAANTFGGAGANGLAPFWDDLYPVGNTAGESQIFTQQVGNKFIIQWNQDGHITAVTGQTITFQIQLDLVTGVIYFAYQDVFFGGTHVAFDQGLSATVGIQWGATATSFIQSSFNTASLTNGQVISFTPNSASYSWSPATFLSATNINNPLATAMTASTNYTVTATNVATGCFSQGSVQVDVNPLPVVGCGGPYGPYCMNDADVTLNATPIGGTWSGTGVTAGGIFDPSVGTQTLTYSYTDGNTCTNTCQVTITVFTVDTDGDGLPDCDDECPNIFGEIGDACDAGPTFVLGVIDASCNCVGVACTTDLSIEFQTDGVSNVGWEIRTEGSNILVQSGGGVYPQSLGYAISTCLPDGCYFLKMTDDLGDGFTSNGIQGGYILRTTVPDRRVIDNRNNFLSGFTSQIANGEGFCLPMGTDRLIFTSCDKLDWRNNEFIVANDNPMVSAQYGVNNANSGYQMWWYDPNGGYSFRRFQSHNTANGLPASATRACHFRVNGWSGNQLVAGTLYNVKVRGRVNGANNNWGAACRFILDPVRAQCPLTKLMDIPGNQYLSCGATRPVGTGQASLVHARPVTRLNGNNAIVSANRYQFRFRIPAELFSLVKTSQTGQYWVNTNGLTPCEVYEVDVRASFDNGATWCTDFVAPFLTDPWGDVCLLNTACAFEGVSQNMGTDPAALTMYPNPNRGDQLFLGLDAIEEGVMTIGVEIIDAFGKRVSTRTIPVQDGFVNTMMSLNGELAGGLYMVNITAGDARYTERLVIQP